MEDAFIQNALAYASQHQLQLAERLGFGIHGIIFVAENKSEGGRTAVKAHRESEPYLRERAVYERLKQADIIEILGFNVPQFIRADDNLRVIEMSIVKRPFVLDFAGAYLDAPPDFSDEIWAEWESGKREQFDVRWPKVQAVLAALEALDNPVASTLSLKLCNPASQTSVNLVKTQSNRRCWSNRPENLCKHRKVNDLHNKQSLVRSNPVKLNQTDFLCSAIPENRAFSAKFSEPSFRMTNDKSSMANFQFRLSALVAACRAAPLRLRSFNTPPSPLRAGRRPSAAPGPALCSRAASGL